MPSMHKFRNPPLGALEEGLCFLSRLCWGFLMFLCLKEDGDGPGGASCPLDQVLESALVKDSFCLHFPSIPYFSQQEMVCAVILQKKKKLCCSICCWLSKGWASVCRKGRSILTSLPQHCTWPEHCLCCGSHKHLFQRGLFLSLTWSCIWIQLLDHVWSNGNKDSPSVMLS